MVLIWTLQKMAVWFLGSCTNLKEPWVCFLQTSTTYTFRVCRR